MDADFINAYLAKQKALIDDFQQRLLIQEVKYQILEQQHATLKAELEKTNKKSSKGENA